MTQRLDLTGQRFGRLVALEWCGPDQHGNTQWHCLCDCGQTTMASLGSLRDGMRKHCGCLRPRKASVPPRHPRRMLYGYAWTPETGLIIHPVAAAHVRQIDTFARQGLTQQAIVQTMTTAYPRAGGRPWHQSEIGRILMNRHLYRGGHQGKSRECWPAIL